MEIFLIVVVALLVLWFVMTYNKLVRLVEAVTNSKKEISVQLDRRGKIFDSLISAVKKYMAHEECVLSKIVELRNKVQSGTEAESHQAQDELSKIVKSGQLTSSLNLVVENYPDLKANTNMLQLQEEIVSTENKLSFAKKGYNNSVETYNVTKKSFPTVLIVGMFNSVNKEFEYWSLSEEDEKKEEAKRVSFE